MSLVDLLCDEKVVEQSIETDFVSDGQHIIELFKNSDLETKRRLLRYFELIEICREINQENESKILSEMFQLFRMLTATILL